MDTFSKLLKVFKNTLKHVKIRTFKYNFFEWGCYKKDISAAIQNNKGKTPIQYQNYNKNITRNIKNNNRICAKDKSKSYGYGFSSFGSKLKAILVQSRVKVFSAPLFKIRSQISEGCTLKISSLADKIVLKEKSQL